MSKLHAALAAIAFLPAYSLAQTMNDQSPLEEVAVIATRIEQPLAELSNNLSVLDGAQLKRLQPVHIQQALSQVPGVSMQRGNGQESLPAIRSAVQTGAGACGSVLVLEEGIPVRGAGTCNVNELFDTHFEQAARIEVVRGPNSVFYGSNALTGSVNVVLPARGVNRVSLEAGPYNYWRAKGAVTYGAADSAHGRLYLTATDDGAYREQSGYKQQKFSWRHRTSLADWELSAGATVTNLDQETAGFIVGLDSYRDRDLARQNLDPEAFRFTESARTWIKLERELSSTYRVSTTVYARDTEMDFLQHFLPGKPLEQNAQTGLGWQSVLYVDSTDSWHWAVGFDAELGDSMLRQTQDAPTQGSAFLQATIPTGTHYDYQVDSTQLALFAHLDWQLHEHWQLLAGSRLETLRYDYQNLALDGRTRDDGSECGFGGCRYSRPADRQDDFTHLSPRLELRYSPSDAWRWSVTLADSFRAPQATELYRLQRAQQVADLDVVQATSVEAAMRYHYGNSQFALSVFSTDTDNMIIRDAAFFNVDGQKIASRGVEFSLRQAINERWQWRVIGSVARHEYASDQLLGDINLNGKRVDTAPDVFGSFILNWQASDRLEIESELQHMGAYYTDPENLHRYPGHTLLHARGAYQLSDSWRASLRVQNVTDQRYAERADFTSFTDERYFPGLPRSVFAELEWEF